MQLLCLLYQRPAGWYAMCTSHVTLLILQEKAMVDGAENPATPGDVVEHNVEGAGGVCVSPQQQVAEAGVVVQGDVARCSTQ